MKLLSVLLCTKVFKNVAWLLPPKSTNWSLFCFFLLIEAKVKSSDWVLTDWTDTSYYSVFWMSLLSYCYSGCYNKPRNTVECKPTDWPSGVAGVGEPVIWWWAKQDNTDSEEEKGQDRRIHKSHWLGKIRQINCSLFSPCHLDVLFESLPVTWLWPHNTHFKGLTNSDPCEKTEIVQYPVWWFYLTLRVHS